MYEGWVNLVSPAVLSGIVVLAAWTLPRLAKQQGSARFVRQRSRANDFSQ